MLNGSKGRDHEGSTSGVLYIVGSGWPTLAQGVPKFGIDDLLRKTKRKFPENPISFALRMPIFLNAITIRRRQILISSPT